MPSFPEFDPSILGLHGKIIDIILETYTYMPFTSAGTIQPRRETDPPVAEGIPAIQRLQRRTRVWKQWKDQAATSTPCPTRGARSKAFWLATIANCVLDGSQPPEAFKHNHDIFFRTRRPRRPARHSKPRAKTRGPRHHPRPATTPTRSCISKRATAGNQLALTRKSYLGLVPEYAAVGEVVCVFEGAHVPFVVRVDAGDAYLRGQRSEAHEGLVRHGRSYGLVGSCFIHGIMGGEAWVDDGLSAGIVLL